MAIYRYRGVRSDGSLVRGEVEAAGEREALERVRGLGVTPIVLRPVEARLTARRLVGLLTRPVGRVPLREMAAFCRQLATMVRAGIPIARALTLLAGGVDGTTLRPILRAALERVEAGQSLVEAFRPHVDRLPLGFLPLLAAGEASGTLDDVLLRMADLFERTYARQQKVRSALTYPAIVSTVALGLIVFMLTYVVPNFATLYTGLKAPLPGTTLWLFHVSKGLQAHLLPLALALLLLLPLILILLRQPRLAGPRQDLLRRLPVVGRVVEAMSLAQVANTLGNVLRAGVPILEGLQLAARAAGPGQLQRQLERVLESVRGGQGLAPSLEAVGGFPALFLEMLRAGEESGSVDDMLGRVAQYYELEAEEGVRRLTTLLEPLLVLVLGGVVALVIIAILIPMYSVFNVLGPGGGM